MTRHKLLYYSLQLLAASALLGQTNATWNLTGDGYWDVPGNWSGATVPNGSDDIAHFESTITGPAVISLRSSGTSNITVNSITFNSPNSYTIQEGTASALIFDYTDNNITITQGEHTISAPITLINDLNVNNNSTSDFTLSGNISGTSGIEFSATSTGDTIIRGTIANDVYLASGTLYLNNTSGSAINGAEVTVGGYALLQLGHSNQFSNNLQVFLQNHGTFDMNGYSTEIGSINFNNNTTLTQGGATLSLNNVNTSLHIPLALSNNVIISGPIAFTGTGDYAKILCDVPVHPATISGSITLPLTLTRGIYFDGSSEDSTALFVTGQITGGSGIVVAMSGPSVNHAREISGSVSNDYTGNTSVINGTLYLNKSSSVAIPANTILTIGSVDGGTVFHRESGQIDPSVAVVMQNIGSWNLNNYNESIKSLAGTGSILLGSGTLTIGGATDTNYSGSIEGTGGMLIKNGAGTLTLSGTNTYTGSTAVNNGGTLSLASGATLTSDVTLNDLSTLQFDNAASLSFSNGIAGTGGKLVKNGAGTLTLSGTNAYTGSTTVNDGGTLSLASGATLTSDVTLNDSSTLQFDNAASLAFSNGIAGTDGKLVKNGAGTLTFTTAQSYTGNTDINNGALALALGSSLDSNVINVGSVSGGILKGVGTINNSVVVNANGTVHPGNSIGTLTIEGDYTTSGVTEIEIDPNGTCSKLVVNGTVTLGGELLIDVPSGFYPAGTSYEIISAQSALIGDFDFVTSHLNGSIYKQVASSPYQVFYIINSDHQSGIDTTGLRGNRLIVARYLNANSHLVGETFSLLHELSGQPLRDALDTISPARDAITTTISQNTNFTLSNILDSRNNDDRVMRMIGKERDAAFLADNTDLEVDELTACSRAQVMDRLPKRRPLPRPKNHSLWATGFGDFTHQKEQHQVPGFNSTSGGLLIGGDFTFGRTTLGAALAYTHASIHEKQHFGHAAINSGLLSIYSTVEFNRLFIEGALWGGMQHTENQRNIFFPGFDATARSSYNSFQGDAHLSSGYYFSFLPGILEPFISVDWACNRDSAYNEQSASPFNMNRSRHFSSALRSEAGLNGYYTRDQSWGTFFLRGKASYVNLIPFQVGQVTAFLTGAPSSFTVTSFIKTQNLIAAAVEFFCQHRSGWFGSLQYDGQYGSNYSNNQATMRVGKMF